ALGGVDSVNISKKKNILYIFNLTKINDMVECVSGIDDWHIKEMKKLTLEGKVINKDGDPLVGMTVLIKGKNKGTITDLKGHFLLEDVEDNAVLIVSYVGYQTKEVIVEGSSNITITLEITSHALSKMVVVGFGKQSKRNLTSSISSLSSEDIENKPSLQVGQALQGKISGAQIIQKSGAPGSSMMVRIRGAGTVNNSSPIYVVDGIVGIDPIDINPDDIKTVDILK